LHALAECPHDHVIQKPAFGGDVNSREGHVCEMLVDRRMIIRDKKRAQRNSRELMSPNIVLSPVSPEKLIETAKTYKRGIEYCVMHR
jgi:hypothetical protein